MPRVFLSYCRSNIEAAKRLEESLRADGIEVWWDKESIYGGEAWPKAIGEGISGNDVLLLVWSKDAAQSHFVEFEWNTAIALKKKILPLLLDRSDLPAALRAVHTIGLDDYGEAVSEVLKSLSGPLPQTDRELQKTVVDKLATIQATDAREVEAAKVIFQQQGWTVQGNVYQASGDLTINIGAAEKTEEKKWWSRPVSMAAALVTVLTLVGLLLGLPEKISQFLEVVRPEPVEMTPLRGLVMYKDTLVGGAVIRIDELPGDSVVTTSDGGFYFKGIPGKSGDRVRVYVRAAGHPVHNEYVALPGPARIILEQ